LCRSEIKKLEKKLCLRRSVATDTKIQKGGQKAENSRKPAETRNAQEKRRGEVKTTRNGTGIR